MGVKLMYVFALLDISKQLCSKTCFSSLDVSEMFVLGVSSMYNVIMQYLNSFLPCSIRNLTLASPSLSFTIKIYIFPFFTSFDSHSGLCQ